MAAPGIAKLWKPVVNVTDLDEGERFWSALSGLSPMGRHGTFSSLSMPDRPLTEGWILLQLVPETDQVQGGTHLDFRVDDVAAAVSAIEAIGGTAVSPPDFYRPEGQPVLEWAIMQDPFGNSFCVIRWPLDGPATDE